MKNSNSLVYAVSIFFKRCWIIGAVVAISALVWLADEPAWAGPLQQFTVPTATPQIIEIEEELVPTPTPAPLLEPDSNEDSGSDDNFDQPIDEPATPEPFFPDDEPTVDELPQPEEDLFDEFNTDESNSDESNSDESNSDEPSSDEPNNTVDDSSGNDSAATDTFVEDTLPDPSFDPVDNGVDDNETVDNGAGTTDFSDSGAADNFSTGGAAGGAAGGGTLGSSESTTANSSDSAVGATNSGVVSISVLNLRRDPNPDADVIDTMWRNDIVEISQTARGGAWLLVCCGDEKGSAGWVSSLFINYDASNLTVGSLDSSTAVSSPASETVAATADTRLELTMTVTDTTVQAGQILDIEYVVENLGSVDAQNVQVNNELPADLYLNNFEMDDTGRFTHTINTQNNRRIFTIIWPDVAASQTVTATITVQIAPDAPNGLVIDNLAGVGAENADGDTAAVSIGTPPLAPPSFRRR